MGREEYTTERLTAPIRLKSASSCLGGWVEADSDSVPWIADAYRRRVLAMPRSRFLLALPMLLSLLVLACGGSSPAEPAAADTPSATPIPTWTLVPPTVTSTPPPTATPLPNLSSGDAIIVGGVVRTRVEPTTQSKQAGSLADLSTVTIANQRTGRELAARCADLAELDAGVGFGVVPARRWLLRLWPHSSSSWLTASGRPWRRCRTVRRSGSTSNISTQTARAMVGQDAVFTAGISSGAGQFPTPARQLRDRAGRPVVRRAHDGLAGGLRRAPGHV